MDPAIWGPPAWFFLHSITLTYPLSPTAEDKLRIKKFFNSLEYVLPCNVCRVHYSEHIRQYPIDEFVNTRKDLVYWLIDIHNMVNISLGKRKWNYDEVLNHFEKYIGRKIILNNNNSKITINKQIDTRPTCNNQVLIYFILFLIFLIIFAVCVWCKK